MMGLVSCLILTLMAATVGVATRRMKQIQIYISDTDFPPFFKLHTIDPLSICICYDAYTCYLCDVIKPFNVTH